MKNMKSSFYNKFNSKIGASIIFALLAFLVVTFVSVVILTVAVSSAKRVTNDRNEEQKNLTLISAAEIVRDEMLKTEYDIVTTITTSNNGGSSENVEYPAIGAFYNEMSKAVKTVDANASSSYVYELKNAFTLTLKDSDAETVNVSFTMTKTHKVVFTLELDSGESIYLSMAGNESPVISETKSTTNNNVTTTVRTSKIAWSEPKIEGVAD